MGVTKETIKSGNGVDQPKKGDDVTIQYTGNLYDESKGQAAHFRGKQYVRTAKLLLSIQQVTCRRLMGYYISIGLTVLEDGVNLKQGSALARSSKASRWLYVCDKAYLSNGRQAGMKACHR